MGQKANPNSIRIGVTKDWNSKYFTSDKALFTQWVVEDRKIRKYLEPKFKELGISNVLIERNEKVLTLTISTSRRGMIIGENGEGVETLIKEIRTLIGNRKQEIEINVIDTEDIDTDATILANEIAVQLENRVSFRMAQKRIIGRAMRAGAKGIRTQVSGRLNGVEMARSEGYSEGEVPLQTIRNDLDYAFAEAHTTYGVLGVKVWVSKGDLLEQNAEKQQRKPRNNSRDNRSRDNRQGAKK